MTCDELGGPELTPERGGEEHEYCSTDLTIAKLSSPSDYSEMYMYKVIYSDILVQGYRYSDLHVYKVIYSNSKCRAFAHGPGTVYQRPFSALGDGYTFTGPVPCPAPSTASACELWTLTSTATVQTYVFESNTSTVVQYTIQPTASGSVPSVLSYSQFMVDVPVPSSTWQTPEDWEPCTPSPLGAVVDAPAEPGR